MLVMYQLKSSEMDITTGVLNQDEAVCISHSDITLGKGRNPTIPLLA